jgi:selenide, water dikinase
MHRLTRLASCAGCAAKLDPLVLQQLLAALPVPTDPRLLAGFANHEDAAVYRLDADRALVTTIDVITPLVDDPEIWGAIAATNALSDVYAVGGKPIGALAFLALPKELPPEIGAAVLAGAARFVQREGALLVGGHSIAAPEPLVGLAAFGLAHPERLLLNDRARPGDQLILTKPLGTGVLTTARKSDRVDDAALAAPLAGMLLSNGAAVEPLLRAGVRAATDVTGFGLLGHAAELARASSVQLAIDAQRVPAYPGARALLADGCATSAAPKNLAWARELGPVSGVLDHLLVDPQTSGGLLAAVPPARLGETLSALREAGYGEATWIGEVRRGAGILLH